MPKHKARKKVSPGSMPHPRRRFTIICLIFSLLVTGGILANRESIWPSAAQKGQEPPAPASLSPESPSKEYVYVGGRLVATEEPEGSTSCSFSISPASQPFAAAGGTGSVTVSTQPGCNWTAVSNAGWISITAGASGTGSGSVNYSVAVNTVTSPRAGTMTIAGQTFTVTQDAAPGSCTYSINPTSQSFGSSGGTSNVSVTTQAGCAWTAVSNAAWISITSGASGTGNGSVAYSVAVNTVTSPRAGTMTIAGQTFTVTQDAAPGSCTYSINPTSQSFGSSGGTSNVSVTTQAGCAWTAVSNAAWINITSGASGTGSGSVAYSVAVNTVTSPRAGTMTIAGQTFTVSQAAATGTCSYSIDPASEFFTAAGGTGSVAVTAPSGCNWNVTDVPSFVTITSGSSGTGSGTVQYSVAVNDKTTSRSGPFVIAGQLFTINQAGCTVAISPTSQNFTASGGNGNVTVTTTSGCPWTAVSNDVWITITSGSSGSGSGTVGYSVGVNLMMAPRTGTLTIGEQTFTVTQEAGAGSCNYSISPTSNTLAKTGGIGTVSVTADGGCSWTAVSNAGWIVILSGSSGAGNGSVTYAAGFNPGAPRTGTLTIAGQTFTVTQQ